MISPVAITPVIALIVTVLAMVPLPLWAATITPLSFGTILADRAGDEITVDASAGAPALPQRTTAGVSIVSGGGNGMITLSLSSEDLAAIDKIHLTFATATLALSNNHGQTMLVKNLTTMSQTVKAAPVNPGEIDFAIGGVLEIGHAQPSGSYSNTISVTVNYL